MERLDFLFLLAAHAPWGFSCGSQAFAGGGSAGEREGSRVRKWYTFVILLFTSVSECYCRCFRIILRLCNQVNSDERIFPESSPISNRGDTTGMGRKQSAECMGGAKSWFCRYLSDTFEGNMSDTRSYKIWFSTREISPEVVCLRVCQGES